MRESLDSTVSLSLSPPLPLKQLSHWSCCPEECPSFSPNEQAAGCCRLKKLAPKVVCCIITRRERHLSPGIGTTHIHTHVQRRLIGRTGQADGNKQTGRDYIRNAHFWRVGIAYQTCGAQGWHQNRGGGGKGG